MTDIAKNFGKRLKELRTMRGLTQAQLAELVNVEVMSISRIETGTSFPKKENIALFAKVLNINIRELFDYGHLDTKNDLIKEINKILKQSDLADLRFYKKIICSYIESKQST